MSRFAIAGLAAIVVAFILVNAALFTVEQTEQALVTELGKPIRVLDDPGAAQQIADGANGDRLRPAAFEPAHAERGGYLGRSAAADRGQFHHVPYQ